MNLKEGIVVKAINYQDNAKIIYLITNEGKQSLIVKGATNFKSHTFSYAQELTKLAYDSKKMFLSSGKILSSYITIKNNQEKLISALQIIEIANELIDHINDYRIFYYFLDDILTFLNEGYNHELLELIFRVKTLFLLGVSPVFNKCVECENKDNLVGFSFYDGGMKCQNHFKVNDYLYPNAIIQPLRTLYLTKLEVIKPLINDIKIDYSEADLFLSRYYEHYLGFKSRVKQVMM